MDVVTLSAIEVSSYANMEIDVRAHLTVERQRPLIRRKVEVRILPEGPILKCHVAQCNRTVEVAVTVPKGV